MSTLSIMEIKRVANGGNLKAFVSLKFNDQITIHGFRIVQQDGQQPWLSVPQQEYTDKNGNKRYRQTVILEPGLRALVSELVLSEWGR